MAQLIDKESASASNSLLEFFSVPPTQTVIESSYWHAARPINTLTNEGPFKFLVPDGPDYLHLARNYLYIKFKVVKPDGTDMNNTAGLTKDDDIGTINAIGKTLIKQLKVHINGKLTYDSGDMYAYRAFLETELNYGWEAKTTWLQACMYSKDIPANSVDANTNTGWNWRKDKVKNSAVVETMAPLHCDLFSVDKLLISNAQVFIELYRNSDAFALMGSTLTLPKYKIEIIDMIWYVKKLQLLSSVHLGLEAALMRMPAKYPIRRVLMTKIHIVAGRMTTPTTSVIDGQIPRRMIIGFVEPDALVGNYKRSPFVFKNAGITQISVHAGGQIFPREPLTMDFANNLFVRPYMQFQEALGMTDDNTGNLITMDDYKFCTCLFLFDLTPEQCAADSSWQLVRQGSVSIHAEFAEAIKEGGLEMVIYSEFDNLCMIDRNRNVYFDYSV